MVIPAWGVEDYLDDCVRSLLAQTHRRWEAVIVDDGSTDRTGEIADAWAHRDNRISVVHSVNGGLGAARNLGTLQVRGDYLAFLDSDDVLPPTAYADLVGALQDSGSDFATGSIVRWEGDDLVEPPWMRRLHRPLRGARVEDRPEILGDVFAWNKVLRRSWLGRRRPVAGPRACATRTSPRRRGPSSAAASTCSTRWSTTGGSARARSPRRAPRRCRTSSDRWETKRQSLASVRAHGSAEVEEVFVDRVLAGDLWRYFLLVPGAHRGVVAAAARRRARALGPALAGAQRAAAGAPAGGLARRARTGGPTSPR